MLLPLYLLSLLGIFPQATPMLTSARYILLLMSVFALVGCGPGSTPVPVNEGPAPAESIRTNLQYIIDSGTVGSEMLTIQDDINKIKETDPAKAEELQKQYDQLDKARGSQARSIAKKMQATL